MFTLRKQFSKPLALLMFCLVILSPTTARSLPDGSITEEQKQLSNLFLMSQPQPNFIFDAERLYEDDNDWYMPYSSDTHDHFAWNLLKNVLQENHNQNVIISPFSVKVALALLAEAAGEGSRTYQELNAALSDKINLESENLREYYRKILPMLKRSNAAYTLNLETKLYVDDFIQPQQKYAAKLHDYYDTKLESLHFADSSDSAATINAWASKVTEGKLDTLVEENDMHGSVLLLANVIYFKGIWRREFDESKLGFFHTPTEQILAEYMEATDYFYYYDEPTLNAKIVRLPYKGDKFGMFVLLPKTVGGGVDELVATLKNEQYKRIQWLLERKEVRVIMPKFKFELQSDLKETLRHLGITELFEDSASLPGLARGAEVAGRLKVSDIYQKAGIEVNEQGTEAFASTVVKMENRSGFVMPIEEFIVNRPFVFFIEEEQTGNIIFAGKVLKPY